MNFHERGIACRLELGQALQAVEDGDVQYARRCVDRIRLNINAMAQELEERCREQSE